MWWIRDSTGSVLDYYRGMMLVGAHVWLTAEDRPIQEGQTEAAPDRIKATVMAEGNGDSRPTDD